MESRFLDRLPLKPTGAGQQTLHPLVVAAYQNEGVYSQAYYHTDLVITYHPIVGMDQPGQVMFGVSREGTSPNAQTIAAMSPQASTACWRRATIVVEKSFLNTQKWLRMRDPCAYLVYWWSTPTPPGYFTFTCTIKAINPFRDHLPPTPEPVEWPTTSVRGQRGPCLYKYGFATCYARGSGGDSLLSQGAWAACIGGIYKNGAILSTKTYTDPTTPACPNFHVLFPGASVLMIVYAMDKVLYQSTSGALQDKQDYAKNEGRFSGITVRWVNREEIYKAYPKPKGNVNNNDFIMGWSQFDYQERDVWRDWADPCPTAIMVAYYALPPGTLVGGASLTGIPICKYFSDDAMTRDPVWVPVTGIPQWGIFSNQAIQR